MINDENGVWVYMLYCKHGQVCYVGVTNNFETTLAMHSKYHDVDDFDAYKVRSREDALTVKRDLVRKFNPPWTAENGIEGIRWKDRVGLCDEGTCY